MRVPLAPYLDLVRKELVTTLLPREDDDARRVAQYAHKILSALWIRETRLPEIEQASLKRLSGLIPRISDAIQELDGGKVVAAKLKEHLLEFPNYMASQAAMQNAVRLLATVSSQEARALLVDIASVNAEGQAAHYRAITESYVDGRRREELAELSDAEVRSLQAYLRSAFSGETDIRVGGSRAIIGGGSKATYFVQLENTTILPNEIVVRIDSAASVQATTVANEHAVLKEMHEAGLPVPEPLVLEMDSAVLGAPFIIVSRMKGHNIGDWNTVFEPSREFAIGVARVLATLHNMPITGVGASLPGADISVKEKMEQNIENLETHWRCYGEPSIAMEQAFIWLRKHVDFADGQRSILHCDVGFHNMLGEDGRLTALLDWETVEIGNPARELTYTEMHVCQMISWEDYLAEYERAGGQVPSQREIDFYRMWRAVFRIHYLYIARAYMASGLTDSIIHAYGSQHMFYDAEKDVHERVRELFERYPD